MTAPTSLLDPALELHGVTRSFGDGDRSTTVLAGVDLTVAPGEIVALLGRSGSGKTTLFNIASGFEPCDAGRVAWPGRGPGDDFPAWGVMAVVPQSLGLLDELTVEENVALPARLAGQAAPDVAPLLVELGIAHLAHRLPAEVSLGEQQRAALARAVAADPLVLLADEPVSHQNDAFADVVLGVLTRLAAAGTACLVATHDTAVVGIADRVLELHEGRLAPAADPAPAGG